MAIFDNDWETSLIIAAEKIGVRLYVTFSKYRRSGAFWKYDQDEDLWKCVGNLGESRRGYGPQGWKRHPLRVWRW